MGQQHTQIAGPVSIVDGDAAFYKDIQQLCDERYGTGYLHRDDFVHWLERPRLLKIALLDGEFAVRAPRDHEGHGGRRPARSQGGGIWCGLRFSLGLQRDAAH